VGSITINMKYIIVALIGFISLTGFSQTQRDIKEANESYKKTDKGLNVYNTILSDYKLTLFS
jgi:hypothetical protein